MKDDKYLEEKAKELFNKVCNHPHPFDVNRRMNICKDLIRTIIEDIDDEYWAQEEYYLDTIKELKKGKPKVSREDLNFLISLINEDYFQLHGSVGMKQFEQKYEKHIIEFLKEAGVEVSDE